jgi:LysM repeat protein
MKMDLPIRWILKMIIVTLVVGMLAGCTRERAAETAPADTTPAIADPEAAADEPEVLIIPVASPVVVDTPTTEPTPTPTPAFATAPYTVQPGDSVSTIAEKFGTTSQVIREMNLLTTDALQVGQVLRVPNTSAAGTTDSPAPVPAGPYEYEVQPGDTLLSIAIEFGVSANDIVVANTLSNPNDLFVGQTIIIPNYQPEPAPTPIPAVPYEYVIQSGDTLGGIAQRFGASVDALIAANTLRDPNNLIQGQVLFIPGYQGATTIEGTDGGRTDAEPATHIVKAGETLFAIAQNYGVTTAELIAANRITDPDRLQAGQSLIIPGLTAEELRAANQIVHTVAAGEGLNAIARRYNVTVNAIMEANNLSNPNFLTVGQKLIIPTAD